MTSYPVYYLDVDVEGCDAGIYLNGAPVLSTWHRERCSAAPTVSEWIVQGRNELALVILAVPSMDGPQPEGLAKVSVVARVSLCCGLAGNAADPSTQTLCSVSWSPPADPRPQLPAQDRAYADVAHPWGEWRWTSAPTLPDDGAFRAEVLNALALIHTPLAQGSTRMLLSASQVKFEEVGRCYAMDLPAARSRFRSMWASMSADPGFRVAPLVAEQVVLQRFCGERLVVPLTAQGRAVLRADTEDGSGWSLPLFFARVDGLLAVVR
jgi:hypothetical protein